MLEVEIKIRANIREIDAQLRDLGFKRGVPHTQIDTYFNGEHKDLKAEDKALRIRTIRTGDLEGTTLNFKGPKVDDLTMTREEIEIDIRLYEDYEALLKGLGFFPAGTVEKKRVEFMKDNITCCLDDVTGLGEFLEIEIMAEKDDYDKALSQINKLLDALGLKMEDTIRTSYMCMLQELEA